MNVNAGLIMLDISYPNLTLFIGEPNVIGSVAMFLRVWGDAVLIVEGIRCEVVQNQVSRFF